MPDIRKPSKTIFARFSIANTSRPRQHFSSLETQGLGGSYYWQRNPFAPILSPQADDTLLYMAAKRCLPRVLRHRRKLATDKRPNTIARTQQASMR
jgi:hypothetical protein